MNIFRVYILGVWYIERMNELSRREMLKIAGAGGIVGACNISMGGLIANDGPLNTSGSPKTDSPSKAGLLGNESDADLPFRISLAQWSLHKLLYSGEMSNTDFAKEASLMGFEGIEYVNSFFKDKARDTQYLHTLNALAKEHEVQQLLIMVDGEGDLGEPDQNARIQSVENHKQWVHAARTLGCHSIRVNAASSGSFEEQQTLAADGLRRLTEFAEPLGINVIVENHGGLSSNGQWLAGVMKLVDHPMCGTLPDFGNFCMDWSRSDDPDAWYDRYTGTEELMPYAKAVSAKSYEFDDKGNEVKTDYERMIKIVLDAGYTGWIGVEYEGSKHSPREGSMLTKDLLKRVRTMHTD
ncbi:MAG: sugar phosphate isomerase/epimerase family protein [Phycisphaerales bacterium]